MKADLHVHTDISDSSYGLEETIRIAKNNGVTHLGITNHDTVKGLMEAVEAGRIWDVKVIPGIEISSRNFKSGKKVHILGYCFELEGENIKKLCDPVLKRRNSNSITQIEILIRNGYRIDTEKILERAKNSEVIYKQHIMAELMDKGYTDKIYSDLYSILFKNGGICSSDIEYVDAIDAVRAIKADGGIAILAHPGQLDSYELIEELIEAGLDGIELNHEDHNVEDISKIIEYADKFNLIMTGGSDFHGDYGSAINIGEITCPNEYINEFDMEMSFEDAILQFSESTEVLFH